MFNNKEPINGAPTLNDFLFPKSRNLGLRNAFGDFDFSGGGLHGPSQVTPIRAFSSKIAPLADTLNAGVLSDARNRVSW